MPHGPNGSSVQGKRRRSSLVISIVGSLVAPEVLKLGRSIMPKSGRREELRLSITRCYFVSIITGTCTRSRSRSRTTLVDSSSPSEMEHQLVLRIMLVRSRHRSSRGGSRQRWLVLFWVMPWKIVFYTRSLKILTWISFNVASCIG